MSAPWRYLDGDNDGRVRIDEVKAAVSWALDMLQQPEVLLSGAELPLAAINTQHQAGQKLAASARRMLQNLGKADATALSVADTADLALIFPVHQLNGDGIITAELATQTYPGAECGRDAGEHFTRAWPQQHRSQRCCRHRSGTARNLGGRSHSPDGVATGRKRRQYSAGPSDSRHLSVGDGTGCQSQ